MRRVGYDAGQQGARSSASRVLHRARLTASLVVVLTVAGWATLAVTAIADDAPTNTSPPTILGTPQAGQTLTEAHGSWTNQPTSYSYRWQRCSSTGTDCGAIPGATAQSYTLTDTDVGHTIVVKEAARNDAGTGKAASSAPTAVVAAAPQPSRTTSNTATTLVASPADPVVNEAVTLIAAVTSSDTSAPSGTVTFLNGSNAVAGCANEPVAPTGQTVLVTCQTWFAATEAQLTAVFSPSADATVAGSASPTVSLAVSRDASSTALDVSKSVAVGASTTYTATVNSTPGRLGTLQATGSVEFFDGGQPIASCASRPLTNAGATCTVSYNAPGSHSITAQYQGDANFRGSSAPAQPMSVVKPPARVLGLITSTMQWTFSFTPAYTKVLTLAVNGALAATVTTRCHGRGCAFSRRTILVKPCPRTHDRKCPPAGTIELAPGFRGRRLAVGTQITVAITRPGWVGKYYRFTIRARRSPRVQIACLTPGSVGPGSGCSAGG